MLATVEWLRSAAARNVPILGVCFGHQLLGVAFGARIVQNPNGRETGSVEVRLTPEGGRDPLFRGLPNTFTVQATHEDVVDRLPAGATLLAGNANTALQAFGVGANVRAVQFHPELTPDGMRAVIESRVERLEREAVARGGVPGERVRNLLAGLRPSPAGATILSNFLEAFT
jgi:GMP synthase (glutamine-hydrolysing)